VTRGKQDDELAEAATVDASEAPATPASSATPAGTTSPSARGTVAVGPGTTLGRYQIEDELGAGGMATVYRARDPQLRRDVAIKVMFPHLAKKPDVARRFQREARAAAGLEHPNILRVYDVGGGRVGEGTIDEPPHLVMELVRGETLREHVERTGPILAEVVACIGAVLCDALSVAHQAGVIHRDVKPGNVLVTEDGRLLLADFGVARIDGDDSLVTRTGALLGTPSFMSPEQAHGEEVDGRSDVYSVGASLYQLATGSMPFSGSTAVVVAAISRGEYTPPLRRRPQIGAELGRAIQTLMAREPAARPASAADAAALLRQVARDGGFGEPRDELAAYFRDPLGFEAARRPQVVAHAVGRAREAIAARALPRAMALLDRVLAIEPDHDEARALAAEIAPRPRRWLAGAIAGAVAVAAAGGVYLATREESPAAAAAPDAAPFDSGPSDPRSGRAGDAAPVPDAPPFDSGPSAPRSGRADAGTRRPRIDAAVALPPPVDAAVPAPDARVEMPIDAAPAQASLTLELDAWCDLSIDGDDRGRHKRGKTYRVDPGRHTLTCTQGQGLPTWTETITVTAGEQRTVRGQLLADVQVKIAVSGGDSVRIAGKVHKNGATVTLRQGRIRVEVLNGGAVVETANVSLPRIAACTLEHGPDLDCYP